MGALRRRPGQVVRGEAEREEESPRAEGRGRQILDLVLFTGGRWTWGWASPQKAGSPSCSPTTSSDSWGLTCLSLSRPLGALHSWRNWPPAQAQLYPKASVLAKGINFITLTIPTSQPICLHLCFSLTEADAWGPPKLRSQRTWM